MDSFTEIGLEQNRQEERRREKTEQYLSSIGKELDSPVSDLTRKERRNLMIAATVGLFVHYTGLIPSRIESLGVTFETGEQRLIPVSIGLVVLYLFVSFTTHAAFDTLQFRRRQKQARRTHSLKNPEVLESIRNLREKQGLVSFVPKIGREYVDFLETSLDFKFGKISSDEIDRRFADKAKADEGFKKRYDDLKRRLEFAADQRITEIAELESRYFERAYWLNWLRAIVEIALPVLVATWSLIALMV